MFGPKVNPVTELKPQENGKGPAIVTLPERPVVFPEMSKPAVIGGILGRAPFTPEKLDRDAIASFEVGRIFLPRGTLLSDVPWKKLNIERPTILMSLTVDSRGVIAGTGPKILYNYAKIPNSTNQAQVSERCGICFLSNPGPWWLKNATDVEDGTDLDCVLIDASNPEAAARFLRQPGVNFANQFSTNIASALVTTAIPLGGRFTRAVTLQNVPDSLGGTGVVRIAFSQPAAYLGTAGNGLRLLANGSITLSGDTLLRGTADVILETAGSTNIETIQYRDL